MGPPHARLPSPQGRDLTERPGALGVVQAIEASLVDGGFRVGRDSVAGRQTVIGRSARFRPGRLGARLHVFVLVAVFKAGMVGREHLDRFLEEAAQYAATVKGGLPSGALAVAVAVVEPAGEAAGGAGDWALPPPARPPGARAPAFPVLVDLSAWRVTCPDQPPHLRRLVHERIVPALGPASG